MRIEHIAIYVNDLERAKNFFTHYSHAAAGEKYHNQKECGKKVCKKSALNKIGRASCKERVFSTV